MIRFLVVSKVVLQNKNVGFFEQNLWKRTSKLTVCIFFSVHLPKEGWVSIPNKQNIKKYGWKRQVSKPFFNTSLAQFNGKTSILYFIVEAKNQTSWKHPSSIHYKLNTLSYSRFLFRPFYVIHFNVILLFLRSSI